MSINQISLKEIYKIIKEYYELSDYYTHRAYLGIISISRFLSKKAKFIVLKCASKWNFVRVIDSSKNLENWGNILSFYNIQSLIHYHLFQLYLFPNKKSRKS